MSPHHPPLYDPAADQTAAETLQPPYARDRKKASSSARRPKVAIAWAQSTRASACGHSSSHASIVVPIWSRRSCATIASCQADKRALSDNASLVASLAPSITYGFISHLPP